MVVVEPGGGPDSVGSVEPEGQGVDEGAGFGAARHIDGLILVLLREMPLLSLSTSFLSGSPQAWLGTCPKGPRKLTVPFIDADIRDGDVIPVLGGALRR
ncbi:hypothetical protein GCM10022254_16710 [Actinomadura meridiana]|uniref:Uncharacterized protein n=1 Tax=Actinomadura meridiana TaxID=559626 RepID=A0ABP8BW66_9ACTN